MSDDVDVLITHTPPNTVRDMVWPRGEQVGCAQLRWRMEEISPILHTFGHVHSGRGDEMVNATLCINAASTDEGMCSTIWRGTKTQDASRPVARAAAVVIGRCQISLFKTLRLSFLTDAFARLKQVYKQAKRHRVNNLK